ncbi:PTS galactitol transporter subunit IIB [Vibrio splendidus]|jgi:galactitol PTS system EIIB component
MLNTKTIIVACGGAVATSTMAAEEIKDLCKENGISIEIIQCRVSEIESNLSDDIALICTTARLDKEFGDIPIFHGMPFISGVGIEKLKEDILNVLS